MYDNLLTYFKMFFIIISAMKGYTHIVDLAKGHIAALKTSHNNGNYRVREWFNVFNPYPAGTESDKTLPPV